jgi:hypothetical protein
MTPFIADWTRQYDINPVVHSLYDTKVSFHGASAQFDQQGVPREPEAVNTAAGILLDQLAWWASALREARSMHPYAP